MATYNNDNPTPATGIAGTVLGSVGTALGLGLFGNGNGFLGMGGNASTQKEMQALAIENAVLKADSATDKKLVEVYNALFRNDKEMNAKIDGINARVLALETAAPLKEQLTDQKIARVTDSMTCCCNAANTAIANLQATMANIGQYYVKSSSVTPLPMDAKNSWTAPTT